MMCVRDSHVNIQWLKRVGAKAGTSWCKTPSKSEILTAVGNKLPEKKIVPLSDSNKSITRRNLKIKKRSFVGSNGQGKETEKTIAKDFHHII